LEQLDNFSNSSAKSLERVAEILGEGKKPELVEMDMRYGCSHPARASLAHIQRNAHK
jgi:hypothetical protein